MESQQRQPNSANLEDLFVTFAQTLLNHIASEAALMGIQEYRYPASQQWLDYEFFMLSTEEAERCLKEHRELGVLRNPEGHHVYDYAGNIVETPTLEQARNGMIKDLILPVRYLLEEYKTFQLTKEQILERYRYFRELWKTTDIRCDALFPLLNLKSDLQAEYRISPQLSLAPFSVEEKQALWKKYPSPGPFDKFLYAPTLDLSLLLLTDFKLVGSYNRKKNQKISSEQVSMVNEMMNVLTAFRLLKAGDVGVLGLLETRRHAAHRRVSLG